MRVLFITHSNIGCAVLSTGLLNRLLKSYPQAVFDIVVGHRAAAVFETFPNLGKLVAFRKKRFHGHYFSLFSSLRKTDYDLIVDVRTPWLGRMLKGKKKLVFKGKPNVPMHMAEQMAALWPEGAEAKIKLSVWSSEKAMQQAADTLEGSRPVMVLAPAANWVAKQWPQKNWAMLCDEIEERSAAPVSYVVVGAAYERANVADFVANLPAERTLDLIGKTNMNEAFAYIAQADLFMGNDSSLGHVAAACGVPMVSLFGPSADDLYRPYGESVMLVAPDKRKRSELNLAKDAEPRLITDITPKMVLDIVMPILNKVKKAA